MKLVDGARTVDGIITKSLPFIPLLGLALGILLPDVFISLEPLIPLLLATMILYGALRLRTRELGKAVSSFRLLLLYILTSRIIVPLLIFFLSRLVFMNDPDIVYGFLLAYLAPTAITSFIWVTIYKGDLALILAIVILDNILAPMLIPGSVRIILGAAVSLDMMGMVLSLVYMIVIPTIVGIFLNESSQGKVPALISPWLAPIAKLTLIPLVAATTAPVADQIRPDNLQIWIIIATCIFFNVFALYCGKLIGIMRKMDKEKLIAFFLATGLKNNSVSLILATQFFPEQAALPSIFGVITQFTIISIAGRFLTKKL